MPKIITLKVQNNSTFINEPLEKEVRDALKKKLGYMPENAAFMVANAKFNNPDYDGHKSVMCTGRRWCKCVIKKDGVHFPTGLVHVAKEFLESKGFVVKLIDDRIKITEHGNYEIVGMEPREYQQRIIDKSAKRQRGLVKLATGGGKCLGRGTPVLMFDGSIKKVEDVKRGDLLMGPNSSPRKVLSLARGRDKMYKIKPKRGESFIVNEPHILSLKFTGGHHRAGEIINISVKDYLNQNKTFKHCAKGYRSSINFSSKSVKIDPYFLGLWLGDGHSAAPILTTKDKEIVSYCKKVAHSYGLMVKKSKDKTRCPQYSITSGKKAGRHDRNPLLTDLKESNLIRNKHVPKKYKCNSRKVRLELLAGLLDSDGHFHNNGFDFISKYKNLSEDVAYIARSLGLAAYIKTCTKTCTNTGASGVYYRVGISGDCSIIPNRIPRKKANKRRQKKDCLVFGFDVEYIGEDEYFGFEIDGDRLFLLGDFTVTHNTATGAALIAKLNVYPFIFYVPSLDLLHQTKEEFERFLRLEGKPAKIGMIGGGECDIHDINVMTQQTAVRALGKDYTKADEEDKKEKDSEKVKSKYHDIRQLIMTAKGMIADECVTGDSIVHTKDGPKRIEDLSNYKKEVLSLSGNSVVWNKVLNFSEKGIQDILEFTLLSGNKIKCTKEHLIMTQRGWVEAELINPTDQILSIVNADVVKKLMSEEDRLVNILDLFSDIKLIRDNKKIGRRRSMKQGMLLQIVNADAVVESILKIAHLNHLSRREELEDIVYTFMVMIKKIIHGDLLCLKEKDRLYLERYWEILVYLILVSEAKTLDCNGIMELARRNGLYINVNILKDLIQNIKSTKTEDTESQLLVAELLALRYLKIFMKLFMRMVRKSYQKDGLILSVPEDWFGGYVTMDQGLQMALDCIQRASKNKRLILSKIGLIKNTERPQLTSQENITQLLYVKKLEKKLFKKSINTSLIAWGINFIGIDSIKFLGKEKVYDIEVENAHNFFANDMLVHNCQHWSADTCQTISDYSVECYYKYGFSATPYRDQGDDILIDACFGKVIEDIKASELIDLGFLVKPDIYMVPVRNKYGTLKSHTYQEIYKEAIVENDMRNGYIQKITQSMVDQDKMTLILVRQINHGKLLEEMIPGSMFISGTSSKKKRREHIAAMKNHEAPVTISTSIFDEGVDVKPLQVMIQAGSGKSMTRALQRVGRVLRPYEYPDGTKKKEALVIDFMDHCRYMLGHSKKRLKIYQTEPLFNIETLKI